MQSRPGGGRPVFLLHGWPYDIHSYVDVAPLLAAKGYWVIVPYLRGFGTTRFLSSETSRNGEPAALAVDIVALMDALKIEKAVLGGFDIHRDVFAPDSHGRHRTQSPAGSPNAFADAIVGADHL